MDAEKMRNAIHIFEETKVLLSGFSDKAEAVDYMTKETGLSKEECAGAYGFIIGFAVSERGKKNE